LVTTAAAITLTVAGDTEVPLSRRVSWVDTTIERISVMDITYLANPVLHPLDLGITATRRNHDQPHHALDRRQALDR
jgi:hypothetical protein